MTASDVPSVIFSAETASGLETASQKLCRALARRLEDERRDRQRDHDGQKGRHKAEGQGRTGPVPRDPRLTRRLDGERQPVLPPTCRWMRAMMLDFGSKKRFCTFAQPPRPSWSMVNTPGRTGNFFRFFSSTLFTTGR